MKAKLDRTIEKSPQGDILFRSTIQLDLSERERAYYEQYGAPDVASLFRDWYSARADETVNILFTAKHVIEHTKLDTVIENEGALINALVDTNTYWINVEKFPQSVILDFAEGVGAQE